MAIKRELAATVLVEAMVSTDARACEKYGVSTRTLRNWRQALVTDGELAALVKLKKQAFDEDWADGLPAAIRSGIDFLTEATAAARNDKMVLRNPAMIQAVAGVLRILAEVHFCCRIMDARLGQPPTLEELEDPVSADGRPLYH